MASGLIMVDIQNDYFPGGAMELVGMEQASKNAAALLRRFREAGRPVYHVQHFSVNPGATFFLPDTEGVLTHNSVTPQEDESVTSKNFPNAFRATDLEQQLRTDQVDSLVICGAMSHMCIDATARAGFDLGFTCTVAGDACATRDLAFGERNVTAADVHAAFMSALGSVYATVTTTDLVTPD